MKIYNSSNVEIVDLVVSDDSYRYRTIMGENALTLTFSLPEFVEIPVGSYCDFQAERYTLLTPQNFKKNNSRNFDYTLILQSSGGLLERYKFRDSSYKKLKFALTAKPHEHLEMLVWNLNQRDSGWSVGSYIDSVEKVINYNHTDCRSALRMMAENFNTEFEIIGKVISLKRVEYNKSNPLALSYGFGNGFKSGVKRDNSGTSKAIEILFVQGGERNIDAFEYGSSELLLPKNQTLVYEGRTYISDANGFSIKRSDKALSTKIEDSLDLSHIYPQRVGTISQVVTVNSEKNLYDFIDNSIPAGLDYSAQIIQGEKMSVVFQSGMLAGKEFDVSYNHASKKFAVVPQEIDGVTMPSSTFPIAVNDTYAVFGIKLPDSYVCNNVEKTGASWDMFREAAKYLYENEDPRFSFTGDLDEMWAKSDWLNIGGKIKLGGYVSFSDEQFQTSPVLIRITGIKDLINKPQKPQIELSNITVGGSTSSLIKDIPTKDVLINEAKKESIRFAKRGFREAKETAEMLQNSLLNFSGSINPITVQTMQLVAGDVSLQFKFVNSKTNPVEIAHNFDFDVSDKKFKTGAGIIQHMTLGITSVSSSHAVSEYKFWDIPAFESAVLDNAETGYYVYIKASKANQTAAFYVSETPIAIESVSGYYHLLVGILNSEFEGDRSWAAMYGYSELSPSRLTVKKVVSPNGNTYFDLENEEIAGNIKFRAADNSLKSVEQGIQEVGRGNNIFPQSEFQNGLFDWGYGYSNALLNVAEKGVNLNADWALNGNTDLHNNQGLNTAYLRHGGYSNKENDYAYISGQSIKGIKGGKKYIVSAYVANHRSIRVDLYIEFFNSNGSWLNYSGFDQPTCTCSINEFVGGQNINGYKRIYAVVTAHQDAVSANVVFRKFGTALSEPEYTDSYAFFCRPMVEEVDALTTKPGIWKPYASSGEITEVKNVANQAISLLTDIASDSKLTPNEKQQVKREWERIQKQVYQIDTQCGILGLDDTDINDTYADFIGYYFTLESYLEFLIDDVSSTSTINATDFNTNFQNCYSGIETQIAQITRVLNVQSKSADYIKAAMGTTTDINGGLMATALLRMKDVANNINGGMSGLADNIGFWTGGTYEQALANLAKVILRKDGSGQLAGGKIFWDLLGALNVGNFNIVNGNIIGRDNTGAERIRISTENIPAISSFANNFTYIVNVPASNTFEAEVIYYSDTQTYVISGNGYKKTTASVQIPYSTYLVIEAGSLTFNNQGSAVNVEGMFQTVIVKNQSGTVVASGTTNQQLLISQAGTYTVEIETQLTLTDNGFEQVDTISYSTSNNLKYTEIVRKTTVGLDGLYSYFSDVEHFYFKSGVGLRYRGALDIPAGLGGASIASNGGYSNGWGLAHSATRSTTTTTIKHNITDTKFTVNLTPKNSFTWYLSSVSAASSPTANDGNIIIVCSINTAIFDFEIVRTPY